MADPRILLFDIENSPNVGVSWGKYDQTIPRFIQEWFMLSFAWKWLGEKETHVLGLDDFAGYERNRANDKKLAKALHQLLNEADVVIAHNGDAFDLPKARTRFIIHGLEPVSPFQTVDTLKVARKAAIFNSNKLGDLGETLGLGGKAEVGGMDTWLHCMGLPARIGDPPPTPEQIDRAWRRMKRYNKADVVLLEKVYLRLRPSMESHPNLAVISNRPEACPKCGSTKGMVFRKNRRKTLRVTARQVYQCKACGEYSTTRLPDQSPRPDFI